MGRERIAILGGGMASLSAAFALTDSHELRERYDVTVYQEGWLLGGKGASVRNREEHHRIEEHGLHVWLGYYENAFTLMRRCYEELGRPAGAPLATLRDAFLKHSTIVVEEQTRRGWEHWVVEVPQTDEWPGEGRELPSFAEAMRVGTREMVRYARSLGERTRKPDVETATDWVSSLLERAIVASGTPLVGRVASLLADRLREAIALLWKAIGRDVDVDPKLRRLWTIFDFASANLVGILREGLLGPDADFEALDAIEFSEWLRRNGASPETLSSGLVKAFYHLAFCDGDGAGAGLALLGMVRMFACYRGAVFYKMRAGMGETVFAPLYEVLRRRGVRFELFHRVTSLLPSSDGRALERIVMHREAKPRDGEYRPLIDVKGLPCWPERPLDEQLTKVDEERTLIAGVDFDRAILGISIGALPSIAPALIAANPRWQTMVANVKTVRTLSMQLWLTSPIETFASSTAQPVVGAYRVPLETWADMSHVLPLERFRDDVRGVLYACGQLGRADDVTPADYSSLDKMATAFVDENLRHLWPELSRDAIFARYFRVNEKPSDRYVLSVAGSQKHRLRPDESGFDRLVLAGDWTRTTYDLGCIESATMSGLQAARALGVDVKVLGEVRSNAASRVESVPDLPLYIDRAGEMALRSPYVMESVRMSAFVLAAQRECLQNTLDRYLNAPARGAVRYVAAGPFVVLNAAFAGRAFSGDPQHRQLGYMPEIDVAFWIPALATQTGRAPRFVWFLPHVFVSTGAAAAAGREIYGFPKSVVDIDATHAKRGIERLSLTGEVLDRLHSETCGRRATILEVTRREPSRGPAPDIFSVVPANIVEMFSAKKMTLAFLKQFRDVEHTDRACYQAVIEADATVEKIRGYGPLPGAFDISWPDYASHPFAADLGVARTGQSSIAAVWADFDFTMQSGREIAAGRRAPGPKT